jgi:hypothetical protein
MPLQDLRITSSISLPLQHYLLFIRANAASLFFKHDINAEFLPFLPLTRSFTSLSLNEELYKVSLAIYYASHIV